MSIRLSDRMMAIVRMVSSGQCAIKDKNRIVADIGCDHGFVSIYMVQNGLADKMIAMDVAEGPLSTAKANVLEAGVSEKIELRLSNGFDAICRGETNTAIIAGMGGQLILSIVESGLDKLDDGYELVMSPQSDIRLFRESLRKDGILIIDEDMIYEDGKFYNIIKAVVNKKTPLKQSGKEAEKDGDDITALYDTYGEYLIKKKSPVLIEYIEKEIEKKQGIYCRLSKKDTENTVNRLFEIDSELKKLSKVRGMLGLY